MVDDDARSTRSGLSWTARLWLLALTLLGAWVVVSLVAGWFGSLLRLGAVAGVAFVVGFGLGRFGGRGRHRD